MKKCIILVVTAVISTMQLYCQNDYIIESELKEGISENENISDVAQFITDNFKFVEMLNWEKGMKFILMSKNVRTSPMQGLSVKKKNFEDFYHQILTVESIKEGILPMKERVPGSPFDINIVFTTQDNDTITYHYIGSVSSVNNNFIPGLVYVDDIDKARLLLRDKIIYIKNEYACRNIKTFMNNEYWEKIKKYSPYKIKQIGAGEYPNYPIKLIVAGSDSINIPFYVILSGTNIARNVDLMKGKFENLFTFKDPKLLYKNISDEDWELIKEGKVRIGMTSEACKLSWGEPKDINSTTGTFGYYEQWVYEDNYLYFENGKLTAIQN